MDTTIPEGTPELDPLQRAGAVALIEDGFDTVRAVRTPGGAQVGILDSVVAVHPEGALLKVVVDAPALENAEDSVRVLVDDLLERSELLADWTVDRCEVELPPDLVHRGLAAADGPDVPPADPAARKARHTEDAGRAARRDADARSALRERVMGSARELRAFPPAAFRPPGAGDGGRAVGARIAAGALVQAIEPLVVELFDDLQVLTQEDTTVAECEGPLWHLERLPDRHALKYDARFARRLLVTVIALTTRFTDGSFRRLSCVAEGIALRLLLGRATAFLEENDLLDDEASAALDAFTARLGAGTDHAWLFGAVRGVGGTEEGEEPEAAGPVGPAARAGGAEDLEDVVPETGLGVELLPFEAWFTPFQEDRYVHPSAAGETTGA